MLQRRELVFSAAAVLCSFTLTRAVKGHAVAGTGDPPPSLVIAIKRPQDFRIAYNTVAIPPDVRVSFAKAVGTKSFDMAEPGAQWQEWDVIRYGLSRRRLKKIIISREFCAIFYELGGFAKSSCVACFHLASAGSTLLWSAYISDTVIDLRGLVEAIQKKQCHGIPS